MKRLWCVAASLVVMLQGQLAAWSGRLCAVGATISVASGCYMLHVDAADNVRVMMLRRAKQSNQNLSDHARVLSLLKSSIREDSDAILKGLKRKLLVGKIVCGIGIGICAISLFVKL